MLLPIDPKEYLKPAGPLAEVAVGLITLGVVGVGVYASIIGLIAYGHGSREASANPVLCVAVLLIAPFFLYLSYRLFRGTEPQPSILRPDVLTVLGVLLVAIAVHQVFVSRSTASLAVAATLTTIGSACFAIAWRRVRHRAPARTRANDA